MKIQFKHKKYQEAAVADVVDCFAGQPKVEGSVLVYKLASELQTLRVVFRDSGYANDAVKINFERIFKALSPHKELKTL